MRTDTTCSAAERAATTGPNQSVRRRMSALAAALLLAASWGVGAQELRFEPIDEGAADLAWQSYRNQLVEALEARNRKALLDAIGADVDNGPEHERGIEEFRRRWDFDDDASPLWRELRKAVTLGGAFVKSEKGGARYCTPYVAAKWPTTVDPFAFGAIVAAGVLVKEEPSSEARTLTTVTHEVVRVEDWEVTDKTAGFPQKWTRIRLSDADGYVPEEQIRSPIEHMACFARAAGGWRLVSFTAGYLPE